MERVVLKSCCVHQGQPPPESIEVTLCLSSRQVISTDLKPDDTDLIGLMGDSTNLLSLLRVLIWRVNHPFKISCRSKKKKKSHAQIPTEKGWEEIISYLPCANPCCRIPKQRGVPTTKATKCPKRLGRKKKRWQMQLAS